MGQQEHGTASAESAESELPARRRVAPWLRRIAAGALALTLGLGQAYAGSVNGMHEGGQGRDKSVGALGSAEAFAGDGSARASSTAKSDAFGAPAYEAAATKATVTVNVEEEGIGTAAWSRIVTRTSVSRRFVSSVTSSQSYATDEEGNRAIAEAVASAQAPNNVAAVRDGAGSITARTSVEVTGNGFASANAGGFIGIAGGGVRVSTWGRTSAEVY